MSDKVSKFGLGSLSCLVVANTIGAGVFTTSGFTLDALGSRESVLLVWLVASLLAMTGAVSFGALARALPKSGGEYLYLSRLLHPAAGFIAGWVSLVAAFAGAEAYAAITMMEYLHLEQFQHLELILAVTCLVALSALHGLLVRAGTALQNLTVVAKALFMLLFIGLGFWVLDFTPDSAQTPEPGFWAWPVQIMWVSLSFTGFNSAIYVAEEAENPTRNIPRALLYGTAATALLYLLINAVFLYSAPIAQLSGKPDIAMISAQALGGPKLAKAVQVLVLLSLFTLISGMAVAGPRVAVKMGEDGYLPPLTLKSAAMLQCALAVLMTLWSNLATQLSYLSLTLSLTSALAVATVFRLPKKEQPNPLFPAVYIGGTLMAAVASVQLQPKSALAALGTLLTGGLLYLLITSRGDKTREPLTCERTFPEE